MQKILFLTLFLIFTLFGFSSEIKSKTLIYKNLMFQDSNFPTYMNWQNAIEYCDNLELLGYTDWRLPEFEELSDVAQKSYKFKNLKNLDSCYWSDTIYPKNSDTSMFVDFSTGYDGWSSRNDNSFVICVRDL